MNRETTNKYDSEFCGNLPIHLINVIQSYGVLVIIDKSTENIIQISENAGALFNMPFTEIPGKPLSTFVTGSYRDFSKRADIPQVFNINGKNYAGIYHDYPAYFILEINLDIANEQASESFIDVFHELKEKMSEIEKASTINDVCRVAAAELKTASGFDKVMIYRFDDNWNGHVIAEEMESGMESYLHLTFPASDIPKTARELYKRNSYRFIPDREFKAVKLYPVINPATSTFLDMSDCNLRAVSAVHIEYLGNMKVMASMSTRIMKDGELWGLIACHHRTTLPMNYKMCSVFELLSGFISSKIATLEKQEAHQFNISLSLGYTSLIKETYRTSKLVHTLLNNQYNILDLFSAEGAVIIHKGAATRKGAVPETNDVDDIVLWLNTKEGDDIYFTNSLSREYDYAGEFIDVASGLLAIPFDKSRDEYILLFRPEVSHVIKWGGDPGERINFEEDMKTYHPRYSFKVWQEKVAGIALPWHSAELQMASNLREFVKAFVNGKDYTFKN